MQEDLTLLRAYRLIAININNIRQWVQGEKRLEALEANWQSRVGMLKVGAS